jgi:hypothetical protein
MSENTYLIKVHIATAFDEPTVLGWAINCIGDQVAEGKITGPVWRGNNGPGVDDIGHFIISTNTAREEPRFAPPEKDLITLLSEICRLTEKAYILVQEQDTLWSDEVVQLARMLWSQRFVGYPIINDHRFLVLCKQAQAIIDAGYGKVE